jgi:hypothetical protein
MPRRSKISILAARVYETRADLQAAWAAGSFSADIPGFGEFVVANIWAVDAAIRDLLAAEDTRWRHDWLLVRYVDGWLEKDISGLGGDMPGDRRAAEAGAPLRPEDVDTVRKIISEASGETIYDGMDRRMFLAAIDRIIEAGAEVLGEAA